MRSRTPRSTLFPYTTLFRSHHYARFDVKPGMTGPWQIAGRNNVTDFEKVVALESEYIRGWSLARDLAILTLTIWRDRSEEHTSELQSHSEIVCRLLL